MKKLFSLLLVLALCLSLFPAAALAEEPVGELALDVQEEETTPPSAQGADTSPYTGEAETDPEELVGADALGGPSDDPDALPEEPVADDLQAATASGDCGDNLTWTLDDEGVLTISGTGDMWNWSNDSGAPWNSNSSSVKTVVIQPGVTSIGDYAFYECRSLTGITIADGVTRIGERAFGSQSLTTIDIPSSVKSIGREAFWCAYGLTSVTLHEGLEVLEDCAFGVCDKLTSVTIPSTVTRMERPFSYCYSLTEILVVEGNQSYSSIDGVLYDASGKTLLQCPGGKSGSFVIPEGVTSIGDSAFWGCSSLTSVTIPTTVTSVGNNAFYNCSSLTSVTIPEGVTSIGNWAFSNCSSLTSVTIPESVTSIGNYAFDGCSSLTDVYYGGTMAAWKQLGMPYDRATVSIHCADGDITADPSRCGDNLIWSLDESGTLTIAGSGDMWDWSYNSGAPWSNISGSVRTVVIQPGVTGIGDYAFYNCSSLSSVTIPAGVTSIGNYAFEYCSGLTSVTIPASVTSIGHGAFEYCSSLTSITIPEGVTSIGIGAFHGCSSLTSIEFPEGVTFIGDQALWGCSSLTSVSIPASAVTIGAEIFMQCNDLTDVYYDGTTAMWALCFPYERSGFTVHCTDGDLGPTASNQCGDNLFWTLDDAGNLTIAGSGKMWNYGPNTSPFDTVKTVRLLSGVTSIGNYAFGGCGSLTSVEIPEGVTSIGSAAFIWCDDLTSVTIPSSVTNIGGSAFSNCSSLTSVEIPSSVTSIGDYVFDNCTDLTEIRFKGTAPVLGKYVFGGVYGSPVTATAYYPANDPTWTAEVRQSYGGSITWVAYEAAVIASGQCGDDLTWTLEENGTLTISGTGDMWNWSNIDLAPWWSYCQYEITALDIRPGVTGIGEYAFHSCGKLTEITVPEGVTRIGYAAFSSCNSLTSVTLPASLTETGNDLFRSCDSLTDIYFGGTRAMWSQLNAPYNHYTITVHCSDGDIAPADVMYCGDNLIWTLSSEGVLTVAGSGSMWNFDDDHAPWAASLGSIKSVRIISGATSIGSNAFARCDALTSVTIPEGVTSIGRGAFYACYGLTGVTIPESVTKIGRSAFNRCYGLTSVTIPKNVTAIGEYAFGSCGTLTEIRFEGSAPSFGELCFSVVTATAYYPANDPSWTEEVRQNYGGTITWEAYALEPSHIPGDINGDGNVNLIDAQQLMRYVKYHDVTVVEASLDVNGDGNVNLIDAQQLMRYIKYHDVVIH